MPLSAAVRGGGQESPAALRALGIWATNAAYEEVSGLKSLWAYQGTYVSVGVCWPTPCCDMELTDSERAAFDEVAGITFAAVARTDWVAAAAVRGRSST
jgi:hypothetical protein